MMQMATRTSVEVTTRQLSLQILKNTVSLGVSSVLYLRNIFAESAFSNIWFEGLQLVQLRPTDKKSALIVNLLRDGVNDALQKECLEQLQLGIHETETDALLESYEFTFGYAGRRPDISVSRKEGDGKITSEPGGQKPVSKAEAKKQTEAVLQSLCAITQQLEPLPANSYVSLRLLFDEKRTPPNYAPKGFASKIDNVSFGGEVPFTAISDKIDTAYHTLKISIQSLADPPQIMPIITEGERRAAVMRIVDEVKAYVLSTGETDVQKLTRILGKSCEPFIATATSQLLASGLLAPEALSGRPWQRPVEQALPTSDRGASEAPPLTTDSQWQQSCARPKTSSAPLEHAAVESTTEVSSPAGGRPLTLPNQANVMKTALSLIEQCKELAKRKRLVDADTVAAFCVVSPEVANELLQRMQSFGILVRSAGRGKIYKSTLFTDPHGQQQHPRLHKQKGPRKTHSHQQQRRQTRVQQQNQQPTSRMTSTGKRTRAADCGSPAQSVEKRPLKQQRKMLGNSSSQAAPAAALGGFELNEPGIEESCPRRTHTKRPPAAALRTACTRGKAKTLVAPQRNRSKI